MSKHSKGPWYVDNTADGNTHIRDANGNSLMCDEQYYPWVPDNPADWELIAAAPDLLAALKDLVKARYMVTVDWAPQDKYDAVIDVALVAIAKATGEPK